MERSRERRGEAYWKERSVIRIADDVDGRASVNKDEKRVLQWGWTVISCLCRYEGWVVVKILYISQRSLYSMRSAVLSLTSAETEGWEWCDWSWELWQQHVQESSGSVGAGFSETWVGCGKESCSSQASSEKWKWRWWNLFLYRGMDGYSKADECGNSKMWRQMRYGQKWWGVHRIWSRGFEQSEELLILASWLLRPMSRILVLEEFSVRRFAVIQDEIRFRAFEGDLCWSWNESEGRKGRAEQKYR